MEKFCDSHYYKSCYQLTYADIIHPVPDLSTVEINESPKDVVKPPYLKRLPGRPRKNRRREVDEGSSGPGTIRRSTTVRCDTCKQFGHNKRTCQWTPIAARKYATSTSTSKKVIVLESFINFTFSILYLIDDALHL